MKRDELIMLADLNYIEAMREQTRACGGSIIEEDGVCLMLGPDEHPIVNNAARLDPSLSAGLALGVMNDFYLAHEHGFTLILCNSSGDDDMRQAGSDVGLVPLISPPEMILGAPLADAEPPEGVEVRTVDEPAGLEDFKRVAQDAWTTYGIPQAVTGRIFENETMLLAPHIRGVVAYLDGQPASCALVHLSHGIAGIYWVSTVGSARGKGLAELCTRLVSNMGFELGARAVSLQASPMGEPIYRRMGFEQIATYQLLARLPADV